MATTGPDGLRPDRRAVSDLIGFVMVFSLIAAVVAIVSVAGLGSLESARDAQQTNNAESALRVLSDNMDDITERGAPSRATEISLEEASLRFGDPVQFEVSGAPGLSAGSPPNQTFDVRPIVYDDGTTELVYVMGAIFRDEQRGGRVVDSWAPIVDEDRLFLPVVHTGSVSGRQRSLRSETVLVRANGGRQVVAANADSGPYDDLWINVTSPRRDLWNRMLGDHPALSCSPGGPETVECELTDSSEHVYVVDHRIAVALEK